MKAVVFDIKKKGYDQRKADTIRTPEERLELCLQLIDLAIAVSKEKRLPPATPDGIDWVELPFKE